MSKKKAIKLATASVLAASSFAAVAPFTTQAATSVADQVTKATKQMKKAQDTYLAVGETGKVVSAKTVQKEVDLAKKYYDAARAAVIKAGGKSKDKNLAKLTDAKKYYNNAKGYIKALGDAQKVGVAGLEAATIKGDIKTVKAVAGKLSKATTQLKKDVYGGDVEKVLVKKYLTLSPAVNAYFYADKAEYWANKSDLATAEKRMETVTKELAKVDANSTVGKAVSAYVKTVQDKIEALKLPVATGVSAINQSTLTITGSGLKNLKAEDVTVDGNNVTTVTSTDGKSATVTLEGTLPANTDVKVTVKDSVSTKDYTVKFGFEPKAVAVQAATFDDDTNNQKLAVTVDGVATSVDYLKAAGYTVEFNAFDKDGNSANTELFNTVADAASTTGAFDGIDPTDAGNYTVQVVIAKGSTVLTSEKAAISVKNLDNAATAISSYELTNVGGFVQNSSTLVVGETATLTKVTVGSGSTTVGELVPGSFDLKSSDETVVAVNSATGVLTAQGLGTAKVTITVGKVTKEVTVTVKGVVRKATKATPASNSVKAIVGGANTVKVKVTDQYGDPITSATSGVFAHYPTNITGYPATYAAPVELDSSASNKGEVDLPLTGATTAGQTGTVLFKNADGDVLGSFTVTTTAIDNAATLKLAYDATSLSTDDTINADLASDSNIIYKLQEFTSENVYKQDVNFGAGYTIKYNKDIIQVDADPTGNYVLAGGATITVTPKKAGSTTLAVYKADGTLVQTKTITVAKGTSKITAVAWKSAPVINYTTTINYKTVLDITEGTAATDDIVKGITLSSPVLNNIRIAGKAAGILNAGDLYIDKNDNGISDVGETALGKLSFTATASSTGTIAGQFGDGFTGEPVAVGGPAKGSLVFSITDETSTDATKPVVATKAVSVDVK